MAETALLVIDMLNAYRHPDAERLIPNAAEIVGPLHNLIVRARRSDAVDLIYVNDNYGDFTASDAVAHIDDQLCDAALRMIERNMGETLITTAQCEF